MIKKKILPIEIQNSVILYGEKERIMEWIQVFTIVLSVFGLFLWARRESATEMREIRKEVKSLAVHQAKLDERYQNFITSLFAPSSKEDLKKAAKETGIN
jgi:hypothetical protein